MSLQEETFVAGEAFDRLDDELDEAVEAYAEADPDTSTAAMYEDRLGNLETMLGGLSWLVEEHGADAEVTVAGLDAGQYARVEDRANAMRSQADQPGSLPGGTRNVRAAMALQDAPFLDVDEGEEPSLDARLQAVTEGKPTGLVRWIAYEENRLSTVAEGNFKRASERLAAISTD